ncbi:MAG: phage major tail tube protein [Hungatella sp.]|jgi:P2 family phage contractile tail tube protein|nr:phage major tail tube protein [Hungatella sp.]
MEFNNSIIPEVINGFNVYDGDGDLLVGVTDEMNMADLASKVATITGAGIAGSYDVPVLGHFDSITQEIPFRILYKPIFEFANPMKQVSFNVRGAIQVTDKGTGVSDFAGFRYVVKGRCKNMSPGNLKPGDVMGSKISIEAVYILYEIDGVKLIEIDKLNNIYRIDGTDLMEKVRRLC